MKGKNLLIILSLVFSFAGYAVECPSSIQYKGGRLLKSGETYYYPTGRVLKSGSTVYYASGRLLKSGETFYYSTGRLLKSGGTLYYPDGRLIKSGETYYYPTGRLLKSGNTFYYDNGRLARSGSTLYRPDGSITAFPIRLHAQIAEYGELSAYVSKDTEQLDVFFNGLQSESDRVTLATQWNGETFSQLSFLIHSGYENEFVSLEVSDEDSVCTLVDGSVQPGASFTLYGKAATVEVNVNEGFDPARVRQLLEDALTVAGTK
ncbi:MAG: hypothetical protein H6617_08110 [Bdellovibrionaceae bacterium]|nr:hypothetical protein [Bdellovibrionales bacterium]MCB9254629.1 hypothetical protein [Pseudobdellovibrionaceae bacterium]